MFLYLIKVRTMLSRRDRHRLMEVHVRFWDPSTNVVKTRYCTSRGHYREQLIPRDEGIFLMSSQIVKSGADPGGRIRGLVSP